MIPRASIGEMDFFSIIIPLPLVSILAVVLIPLLRPVRITAPWSQDVFAQSDIADSD